MVTVFYGGDADDSSPMLLDSARLSIEVRICLGISLAGESEVPAVGDPSDCPTDCSEWYVSSIGGDRPIPF